MHGRCLYGGRCVLCRRDLHRGENRLSVMTELLYPGYV